MKHKYLITLVLATIFAAVQTLAQDNEKDAVRVSLENYLKDHATGDGEYHRKAFYTEGQLIFVRDGKYTTRSFAEYIAGSPGRPAADEDRRKRWIEMIDVSGNAAIAKIILDYPTTYFVDYFALLKIDGVWRIVNKSFYARPQKEKMQAVSDEDKKAIRIPLKTYLKVGETFDGKLFHKAFQPKSKIMSISNGKVSQMFVEDYAALYTGKPDDEDRPKTSFDILDVYGSAAIARVNLDFPRVKFTDYMTLLKIDGEWKIVNKIFSSEPKKRAEPNKAK